MMISAVPEEEQAPLAETIARISRADIALPDSHLARLSELAAEDLARLASALAGLPSEQRRDILSRLAELGNRDVSLVFHDIFRHCLADPDAGVRREAVRALWECEDSSLADSLIALLEGDMSAGVQTEAAQALGRFALLAEHGKLDDERAARIARILLRVSENASRPLEVRQRAIEAVAPLTLSAVKTAIDAAYNSGSDRLRISSLRAMGKSCDPSWLPCLLHELSSADADIRREAAEALGEIEEQDAVPQLAELVYDDAEEVRLATVRALSSIGGAEAVECLKLCLEDPDATISQAAEEALQELSGLEDMSSFLL